MRHIDADALVRTIEDKRCADCPEVKSQRCGACQWDDAIAMIEEAPTAGGWVNVNDRLPDGECIAYSAKWFEMIIGYVYKATASDTGYEAESENEVLRDVTHWMPFPKPPDEVNTNA